MVRLVCHELYQKHYVVRSILINLIQYVACLSFTPHCAGLFFALNIFCCGSFGRYMAVIYQCKMSLWLHTAYGQGTPAFISNRKAFRDSGCFVCCCGHSYSPLVVMIQQLHGVLYSTWLIQKHLSCTSAPNSYIAWKFNDHITLYTLICRTKISTGLLEGCTQTISAMDVFQFYLRSFILPMCCAPDVPHMKPLSEKISLTDTSPVMFQG